MPDAIIDASLLETSCPVSAEVSALFLSLRAPLIRYTSGLGLARQDSEDVAQETFLSLFHHLRQGKPADNLRGWIFRVGHNLALKRRQRNRFVPVPDGVDYTDPAPDPERATAAKHQEKRLQAILRAMPERDRCCLLLRAEGLGYREIAETLDISLGTAANSVSRALNRLEGALR